MADKRTTSFLSEAVYSDLEKDDFLALPGDANITRFKVLETPESLNVTVNSGYYGAIIEDTVTGEIMLVNRGTEPTDLGDIESDLNIVLNGAGGDQFADANRFFTAYSLENPANPITVTTGHSLGGYLSQALGIAHDFVVYAFGSPGFSGGIDALQNWGYETEINSYAYSKIFVTNGKDDPISEHGAELPGVNVETLDFAALLGGDTYDSATVIEFLSLYSNTAQVAIFDPIFDVGILLAIQGKQVLTFHGIGNYERVYRGGLVPEVFDPTSYAYTLIPDTPVFYNQNIYHQNFWLAETTDGGSFSFFTNPTTNYGSSLQTLADGSMVLTYQDASGFHTTDPFNSPLELTDPDDAAAYVALTDNLDAAVGQSIIDFYQNGGSETFMQQYSTSSETTKTLISNTAFSQLLIDGQGYEPTSLLDSLYETTTAVTKFITDQVDSLSEWFTATDGAQLVFAEWLGDNMQDIVDGNLDLEDAFVSLAEYIAIGRFVGQLSDYAGATVREQAEGLMTEALKTFGVEPADALGMTKIFGATLESFATKVIADGYNWNSTDYANAGVTSFASVVSYNYARSYFGDTTITSDGTTIYWDLNATQTAQVGGTVAAVTTIVSSLLQDPSLNTQEYIQLGAQAGVAAAAAATTSAVVSSEALAASLGSFLGPVGFAAGAIVGFIGGKILGSLFGSTKLYKGEYLTMAQLLDSIYTVQQIDDGSGNLVDALVATNPQGSVILLKSGYTTAIGGSGSDNLVATSDSDYLLVGNDGADYLEGKAGDNTLMGGTFLSHNFAVNDNYVLENLKCA